jgi:hypothetical protein
MREGDGADRLPQMASRDHSVYESVQVIAKRSIKPAQGALKRMEPAAVELAARRQ